MTFAYPFCVRTDRAFCGTRCRVWWYRHPGHKRLDFSPGDEIPARQKHGQPKTLAEALVLLDAERTRAAELEDAAKRAQTQEGILRKQLATLRDELTEERKQLAALHDELTEERRKYAETDLQLRKAENKVDANEERVESLLDELRIAEERTSKLEDEVEDERRRTEDVRYDLTQEIKQLRRELDEQRPSKERVSAEQEELNRQFEELRLRFEENAQSLMRRDGELTKQRQDFAASERAHREIHATADSIVRSLAEEKHRRIAAERHVEELRQALRRVIMTPPSLLSEAQRLVLLDLNLLSLSSPAYTVRESACQESIPGNDRLLLEERIGVCSLQDRSVYPCHSQPIRKGLRSPYRRDSHSDRGIRQIVLSRT